MEDAAVRTLLGKVARQDEAAFTTLYKAFSGKVYAYVLNQVNDPARAEEILVDTMHELWRSAERFRGESRFSTWLIGIARYKVLMAYRGRRADEVHDSLDDIAETEAADSPDGFAWLADRQRQQGVRQCMDKLSRDHRECLHLAFFEDWGLAEIATVQQVPENTVKTRVHHAKLKIKKCLDLLRRREGGTAVGEAP